MNNTALEEAIEGFFPKARFDQIKEFFYHVNADNYDVKVMITRRSYSLYKLFTELLCNGRPGFVEYNNNLRKISGLILNTHSRGYINQLIEKSKNRDFGKEPLRVLLVDDVIINGRTIGLAYKYIEDILKIIKDELNYDHGYNLDVWCLALCDSFNPNFGVPRDSIKTYWPVSVEGWKNESDCLTNMIINWDKGYTSYLKVFECKKALNDIAKIIETNDSLSDRDFSPQSKLPKNSNYYCAIKNTNKFYTSIIRMYTKTGCPEETIIVPYVFIHKVSKGRIKDVYDSLEEAFHIGDIPKCFINANINNEAALQFYKWLTYKASEKLLKKFNSFMSLDVKEIFDCKESFFGVDDPDYKCYQRENDCIRSVDDEIKTCINKLSVELNNAVNNSFSYVYQALNNYLIKMRDEDEKRAQNGLQRFIGIPLDFINENNKEEGSSTLSKSVFYSWDTDIASGNVECIKIDGIEIIGTFLRPGEQVFFAPYIDYYKEFVILSLISKTIYEFNPANLMKVAKEFVCEHDNYKLDKLLERLIKLGVKPEIIKSDIFGLSAVFDKASKKDKLLYDAKQDALGFLKKKGLMI